MNHQLGYRGNALNVPVDARARRGMRPASPMRRARPDHAGVAMPALTISSTLHDGGRVLALDGEIDLATESRFQDAVTEALITQPSGRVVLDCTDLRFIDSSGLRVLIRAHKTAKEQQALLVIAAPLPRVMQTLRVTSLDTRIPVFASVSQALAAPQTTN
jgi:anti-sigma B factor antagonist